ncbi:MAG: hypothetical protein IMZ64_09360 [Bacteroidetes bacterium]|nr:hypothetical protein [Bacteroidota bacterium]
MSLDYTYEMTIKQLIELCRFYQSDNYDGEVVDDDKYIETKLKVME